jgi:hypothetical protein
MKQGITNGKGYSMKMKVLKSAWMEAKSVCGGMYRMNATTAIGYAFRVTADRKHLYSGEFMFTGEPVTADRFDGYVEFKTGQCFETV